MSKVNYILLLVMIFSGPFASALNVNCQSSGTYCQSEFEVRAQQSSTIHELIFKLPRHIKRNVTFKRGNNINKTRVGHLGPHGHKVSKKNSSSASPREPRVIVWDEKSGFTASWNSGNTAHAAHDRIDLYDFDFTTNTHRLTAWFPEDSSEPKGIVDASYVDSRGKACTTCHGMVQRPIFPMYPDWPQFYGEFNDEMAGYSRSMRALRTDLKTMANSFQPKERTLYLNKFQGPGNPAETNPRYSLLFDVKPNDGNKYYPYRPRNTTSPFSDVSRAFYHRPNLRLGVLYNRLTALQTFEKIKQSPIFQKFPDIMFYSMLDCNWDFVDGQGQTGRKQILGKLVQEAQKYNHLSDINLRGAEFSASEVSGEKNSYIKATKSGRTVYYKQPAYTAQYYRQIPYEDLLKLLNLKIADLDIRFKHNSAHKVAKGYNVFSPKAFYHTDNAMDIGYSKSRYPMNPICDNSNSKCNFSYNSTYMQGMKYFNSYFDGSATMNELLAAQMLIYLVDKNQNFPSGSDLNEVRSILRGSIPDPKVYFETLKQKYRRFTARLRLDNDFFSKMDEMSPWIQLPYPPDLINIQNRESFWSNGARRIRARHAQWTNLSNRTNNVQNKNNGQNICWKVYSSMHKRYRQSN